MKYLISILLISSIMTLYSCEDLVNPGRTNSNERRIEKLLESPTEIVYENRTYILKTSMWCDFMPSIGIESGSKKSMICISEIVLKDKDELDLEIKLKNQFVIKGDSLWISRFEETEKLTSGIEGRIERSCWALGKVHVVCRFKLDGKEYFIRAENQNVKTTF